MSERTAMNSVMLKPMHWSNVRLYNNVSIGGITKLRIMPENYHPQSI
jgi:hypothetical protein